MRGTNALPSFCLRPMILLTTLQLSCLVQPVTYKFGRSACAGIEIVTLADYFAVGNRAGAFLSIAPAVARHETYRASLTDHLVSRQLRSCLLPGASAAPSRQPRHTLTAARARNRHWDRAVRTLAAQALRLLVPLDPTRAVSNHSQSARCSCHLFPPLLPEADLPAPGRRPKHPTQCLRGWQVAVCLPSLLKSALSPDLPERHGEQSNTTRLKRSRSFVPQNLLKCSGCLAHAVRCDPRSSGRGAWTERCQELT